MKLKEIHRTSTFAWSPISSIPTLATGTVSGALDESFSNESALEIWTPNFLDLEEFELGIPGTGEPARGVVMDSARFNRLAWGFIDSSKTKTVIAAGMENGELVLWDPDRIIARSPTAESQLMRNNRHTGPVRALDFNPNNGHVLASGAIAGEVSTFFLYS
jgi:protein transport protein SEC31